MRLDTTLQAAIQRLTAAEVPSPRLNAETLLMFTLGCDRAHLYAHPERELAAEERARYEAALAERARGVPAQYITGHQEFWGLDFIVTPAVLIPRPETEHVVETVLELAREKGNDSSKAEFVGTILDVGTGSGCIALALAHELRQAEIIGCDVSPAALEIARANAARLGFGGGVSFYESDLLEAFPEPERFDLVVSNPPYVATRDAHTLQKQVREHEPHLALFAGEQGLAIYERLVPQAQRALKPGGWFVSEMGLGIEQGIRALLRESDWSGVRVVNDLRGIARVVAARKRGYRSATSAAAL